MKHLTSIEELTLDDFNSLLSTTKEMVEISEREIKKVPTLRGKTIVNLFFESSTRTRSSFEIAGKWLSADVINFSASTSSLSKGETFLDTARTLEAMAPDIIVVRHSKSGACEFLRRELKSAAIVNAGDGAHEHPTQALLDCTAMLEVWQKSGEKIAGKKVAIVGDIVFSRVARSLVWALSKLGISVNLVGPPTLVPKFLEQSFPGVKVKVFHDLRAGIKGCDAIEVLRLQGERHKGKLISSISEYCDFYEVTEKILSEVANDSIILHPGPVNRGVEVTSEVADGPRSLIDRQVRLGVAVRMAALFWLATQKGQTDSKEVTSRE